MIYSFGNRAVWCGSFEHYLFLEDRLATVNAALTRQDCTGGMVFDYFLIEELYRVAVLETLEELLGDIDSNAEIESELLMLREVFRCGPVVMG